MKSGGGELVRYWWWVGDDSVKTKSYGDTTHLKQLSTYYYEDDMLYSLQMQTEIYEYIYVD